MDVHIPQLTGEYRWKKIPNAPGWLATEENGKSARPVIRCNCGEHMGIENHHIHADGRVTASFYDAETWPPFADGSLACPRHGCGWHVFLILDGWDRGEFLPGK
jgi:hypothetical protein